MSVRKMYPRRTEPNMRQELNNMFDGIYPEIAKKQKAILRKMRRDSNGSLTQCSCVDALTHEPDKDTFCPYCHGEGYYWDESLIDVYKVEIKSDVGNALRERLIKPGLTNPPVVVFYLRSTVSVTKKDRIVELILNDDGTPYRPYTRKVLYRIGSPIDLRSDDGKLEYWKVTCYEEERKYLNGDNI